MDINMIIDELYKRSDVMDFNDAASEDKIKEFQELNKIVLPPSYVELLKRFDGGELFIPGIRIYGISEKGNCRSIKQINGKSIRKGFKIPVSLLIIGKLNYGDWICIELNDKYEIIQWDHEKDEEFCRWSCIEEWLTESIDNYTRYEGGASR